jgi:hypothetical protein
VAESPFPLWAREMPSGGPWHFTPGALGTTVAVRSNRGGLMAEPTYQWVCTCCDASGMAESSEMARLAVDVHVSVQHQRAPEPEPDAGGDDDDDDPEGSRA